MKKIIENFVTIMIFVMILTLTITCLVHIQKMNDKLIDQQQIIEELVKHTGYDINIPCANIELLGRLKNLECDVMGTNYKLNEAKK